VLEKIEDIFEGKKVFVERLIHKQYLVGKIILKE